MLKVLHFITEYWRNGLEIDDPIIDFRLRIGADPFFDHEPATASVDLALVVLQPLLRKVEELFCIFAIGKAPEVGVTGAVLQCGGMDAIVVARVELPDVPIGSEQIRS